MTLDEYRTKIIESLKARPDIVGARDLLAQTHLVLINSGISARTQTTFWESLNSDLEFLAEESTLLEEHAATALRAVTAAAQAVIAQYQRLIAIAQQNPRPYRALGHRLACKQATLRQVGRESALRGHQRPPPKPPGGVRSASPRGSPRTTARRNSGTCSMQPTACKSPAKVPQ